MNSWFLKGPINSIPETDMAKGHDRHIERLEKINSFGKDLARRSKSGCELCSASGVPLSVLEVGPQDEPDIERCIFVCETCRIQIENPKKTEPDHFRCLSEKIWSEIPAVKVQSFIILKKIAANESWAADLIEDVYLEEEEE